MSTTFVSILAQSEESTGGSILSFLFLPGILLLLYFIMIRPQRKRMREQAEATAQLQAAIGIGSEVVTVSGIYGTITGEDGDDILWLEIDDDVQIRIARAAIQKLVTTDEPSGASDDDQLDDADSASSSD